MAQSLFVGAGPAAYDASDPWPSSLAVSSSTPTGVLDGDRVLLIVMSYAYPNTSTLTCPTPTEWTLVNSRFAGDNAQGLFGLWVFTSRWSTSAAASLVQPTYSNNNPSLAPTWRFQTIAYRPSKSVGDSGVQSFSRTGSAPYFVAIGNSYGSNGSTEIGIHGAAQYDLTGTDSAGLTLRLDQPAITNRLGGLRVGDRQRTDNVSTGQNDAWLSNTQGNFYPLAVTCHLFLDAPSDDPALGADWSIGRIAY